ncbi:hypothetical protein Tco_0465087 [Tanacetum coccineum]
MVTQHFAGSSSSESHMDISRIEVRGGGDTGVQVGGTVVNPEARCSSSPLPRPASKSIIIILVSLDESSSSSSSIHLISLVLRVARYPGESGEVKSAAGVALSAALLVGNTSSSDDINSRYTSLGTNSGENGAYSGSSEPCT